jgi:hypothetical protein
LEELQNVSSVELNGTLEFRDVLKFQYSQWRSWWILLLLILVSLIGGLLAVVAAMLTPNLELARRGGTWFFVLLMYWLLLATTPYRGAKRQMKTNLSLTGPILYVFSSRAVRSAGAHFSDEISYQALWSVRETRSLFMLHYSASSALVLPKRFFKDAAQENDRRTLVEGHITPKVITKSGFLGRWL